MRRRLIVMAAATTTMVVVALMLPLGIAVQTIASNQALNEADSEARSLAPVLATVQDRQVLSELVQSANATSVGHLSVFLPDGSVLGAQADAGSEVLLARTGRSFTTRTANGADVLVPVVIPQAGVAVIEVAVPNSRLGRGVTTAWLILGATGLGLILLAVFVADRIARDVVAPTRALADAARQVARGQLQTRVRPTGPAEMIEVGRTFNILVGRISELLSAEREAAADLSHRLRTPLTALRLDVERLVAGSARARLEADVGALDLAVDDVIRKLRHHSLDPAGPTTDLAAVVRQRMAFWAELADEQGRRCRVQVETFDSTIALRREELEAMLDVLVGNVFAHTPEKSALMVLIDAPVRGLVRLMVEDEGPGFPPAMVGRGRSAVGSTGLGLDIARRAAQSAGGSLSISRGAQGGARVEVLLRNVDPTHTMVRPPLTDSV